MCELEGYHADHFSPPEPDAVRKCIKPVGPSYTSRPARPVKLMLRKIRAEPITMAY